MANATFIPFNFNPDNNVETASSYTVPANTYAIVYVTMSADAYGQITLQGLIDDDTIRFTVNSNAVSMKLHLKTGETITKTETSANSDSNDNSLDRVFLQAAGTSVASVSVGGVEVGRVTATATSHGVKEPGGGSTTVGVRGSASVKWHIAEYSNPS